MDGQPDWLTQLIRQKSFGTDIPPGATQLIPPPQPDIPAPDINLRPGIEFKAPGQERNIFAEPGPPDIFRSGPPSAKELAPQPSPAPPDLFTRITGEVKKRPQLGSPEQQPSKFRKALGMLGGMSMGLAKGPEAGMQEHQDINEAPYRRHVRQWADTLAPLYGEAEQEAARTKQNMDLATTQAEYERAYAEHMRAQRLLAQMNEAKRWVPTTKAEAKEEAEWGATPREITPDFESHYEPTSGDVITTNKRTGEVTVHKGVGTPRPEKPTETPEEKFNWEAKLIRLREGLIAAREKANREGKGTKVGIDDVQKATRDAVKAVIIGNPRWAKFAKNGEITGREYGTDQYGRETMMPLDLSKPGMQQDYDAFLQAVHENAQDILDQHYGTAPPGKLEEDSPRSQAPRGKFSSSKVVE